MTDAERWTDVKTWLDRALEQPADARTSWLAAQHVEPGVRAEVLALLDSHARASGFLEGSALDEPGAAAVVRDATEIYSGHLSNGYRLGPYQILRAIGEGGMGTVYLAARADDAFEKHVAIKLVRLGGSSAVLADRLRQERRVLAVLEHPNIARLLDGGTTPVGVPYVVMEHVEGVPIDTFCEQHNLPVVERVRLVQGVCQAVQHAHAHLIVHRDIKAEEHSRDARGAAQAARLRDCQDPRRRSHRGDRHHRARDDTGKRKPGATAAGRRDGRQRHLCPGRAALSAARGPAAVSVKREPDRDARGH